MFCKKCGTPVSPDSKFCTVCGNRIGAEAQPVQETPESNAVMPEASAPAAEIPATTAVDAPAAEIPATTAVDAPAAEIPATTAVDAPAAEIPATTAVDAPAADIPATEAFETPVFHGETQGNFTFEEPKAPPVKKKRKGLKIALISVAAVILATTIAAFASPVVGNFFMKLFLPSNSYFKHVVKKNSKDAMTEISTVLSAYKQGLKTNYTTEGNMKITLGDGLKEFAANASEGESVEYLNWINTIDADVKMTLDNMKMAGDMKFKVNGNDLTGLNMAIDMENLEFYYSMPDINPTPLRIAPPEEGMRYEGPNPYELVQKLMEILPDEQTMNRIFSRYATCAAEQVKKVSEKNEKVNAGGVSKGLTKLTAKIDGETLLDIAKAVLKELKGDDDVKNLINNVAKFAADNGASNTENAYDNVKTSIDKLLDRLDEVDPDDMGDESLDFILWVDGAGEIAGFGFEIEGTEFRSITVEKGKKFGYVMDLTMDGAKQPVFVLEGSGTNNGDKMSGDLGLKVNNMDILTITYDTSSAEAIKNGTFNGTYSIQLADSAVSLLKLSGADEQLVNILSGAKLTLTENATPNNATAEIAFYTYDKLWASIAVTQSMSDGGTVTIPSDAINIDDENAATEWLAGADLEGLLTNLEKAGLPSEAVNELRLATTPQPDTMFPSFVFGADGGLYDPNGSLIATPEVFADDASFDEDGNLVDPETGEILVSASDLENVMSFDEAEAYLMAQAEAEVGSGAIMDEEYEEYDESHGIYPYTEDAVYDYDYKY